MTRRASAPRIVDVDDGEWSGTDADGGRWKRLGRLAGGTRLGCTIEEVQPGGRPAGYHYHLANEEAMYVVEGTGTLRTPDGEQPIGAGDYVAFPAGESGAHAVENTSAEVLGCLFVSTMREPDVVVHPDEETLAVVAGAAPGRPREERTFDATFPYDADPPDAAG